MVLRRDEAPAADEPALCRLPVDRVEEPRLADAGLPGDEEELAMARLDVVESPIGELEQVVASDEERAANRTGSGVHVLQFRALSSPVIGHSTDDGWVVEGEAAQPTTPIAGGRQRRRQSMAKFMDVHSGFYGVTSEQLDEAHGRDLAIEAEEGVHFERAWLDPEAGKVFCLATGPSRESVMRIHERAGHPTGEVYELRSEV